MSRQDRTPRRAGPTRVSHWDSAARKVPGSILQWAKGQEFQSVDRDATQVSRKQSGNQPGWTEAELPWEREIPPGRS